MDSKLYRELSEAYLDVYAPKEILESKDEEKEDDEEEEEEDSKKKSSKKKEEEDEDEMEEMDEEVETLDEISANLAMTAASKADEMRRRAAVAGDRETAAKKAAQASRIYKGVGPRRTRERMRMGEEIDIFDEVIEFLCVEGYAETLEDAEWMMANLIDEEAIEIILGEEELDEEYIDEAEGSYGETPKAYSAASKTKMTAKRKPFLKAMQRRTNPANRKSAYDSPRKGMTADDRERARAGSKHGVGTRADHDYPSEGPGGVTKSAKKLRKQKAMGEFAKEAFEAWLDEAMTNYEKNRKRAAQRAAARNAARDQGKTGAVPGVGYVTPRREREKPGLMRVVRQDTQRVSDK